MNQDPAQNTNQPPQSQAAGTGPSPDTENIQSKINEAVGDMSEASTPPTSTQAQDIPAQAAPPEPTPEPDTKVDEQPTPTPPISPKPMGSQDVPAELLGMDTSSESKAANPLPQTPTAPETKSEEPAIPPLEQESTTPNSNPTPTGGNMQDMPLAFAGGGQSTNETAKTEVESPSAETPPTTPPVLPPTPPVENTPSEPASPQPKKAKGGKKVILAVLGFFLLVGSIGAAAYYYFNAQTPDIAVIEGACQTRSKDECSGCMDDKYECKWDKSTDECKKKLNRSACGGGGGGGTDTSSCGTSSGAQCQGKGIGDSCGSSGSCVYLSNQSPGADGKAVCGCESRCWSNSGSCSQLNPGDSCGTGGTCTISGKDDVGGYKCSCSGEGGGAGGGGTGGGSCGSEPTYTYNKAPTRIGPFPESGKVVLYYKSLLGTDYKPKWVIKDPAGTSHTVQATSLDSNKRARIVTNIQVSAGDYVTLQSSEDNIPGSATCAPESGPPYMSFGWIATNSDNTCGSGLPGPPTAYTPFEKVNVAGDIAWAEGFGKEIVGKGKQCWADWREWPGDYDFNDYFLMVSYDSGRQDICGTTGSTRVDKTSLKPGETATVTSNTGGTKVNVFTFAFYNRDNLYGPGNPKPICVTGTGGWQGDCPSGSQHLILSASDKTTMRTTGSTTFKYEDVFVADKNWNNKKVERIQINGYFRIDDGPTSLPNPKCVTYTAAGEADPTVACTNINRGNSNPSIGDNVQFTCNANASNGGDLTYYFRYKVDDAAWTSPVTSTTDKHTYEIDKAGRWYVQCRACTPYQGKGLCSPWGVVGGGDG